FAPLSRNRAEEIRALTDDPRRVSLRAVRKSPGFSDRLSRKREAESEQIPSLGLRFHPNSRESKTRSTYEIGRQARFRSVGARSDLTSISATVAQAPHQFRSRMDLIEMQRTRSRSNKNAEKSTKLIDSPPLITVWLQVRVLPGPPANQWV